MRSLLARSLATEVLESIAGIGRSKVLFGQIVPSRASRCRRFPRVNPYSGLSECGTRPVHSHPQPHLGIVLQGRVNVIIGHALYEARAGDWLIVRSDVPHGEFCVQSRAGFRTIWFGCWSKDLYPLSMSRYSRVRGYGFDWYSRISKSAAPAFDMAMETVLANPNQRRALLQLNLARLAMWWLETLDAASDRPDKTSYPLVNEIWSILKAGKGRPPSVSKLARGVGLSRGHLSKLFHAYTGQTLRRSILENRLDNARRYLARPTLPIKEISYLLGFASPQHFCHTFRQFVGVSPTVFRRNLRGQRSKR